MRSPAASLVAARLSNSRARLSMLAPRSILEGRGEVGAHDEAVAVERQRRHHRLRWPRDQ
eukprot:1621545-Prymnesium_polylepis.1